jgi:hypothetical protein
MLLMTIKHLIVAYTMGKYSGSKAGEERAQRIFPTGLAWRGMRVRIPRFS